MPPQAKIFEIFSLYFKNSGQSTGKSVNLQICKFGKLENAGHFQGAVQNQSRVVTQHLAKEFQGACLFLIWTEFIIAIAP